MAQAPSPKASLGIDFFHGTWEEVQAKAAEEDKFIMVDGFTTWCGPCRKMSSITFKDERVGRFFNKHFINYKLDMEKGEGPSFRKKYNIRGYPTVIFFASTASEKGRFSGYRNPLQFLVEGRKIVADKAKITELTTEYEAGNRRPEFLYEYLQMLQYGGKKSAHVAKEYLRVVPKEEYRSAENMELTFDALGDINSPFYELYDADRAFYEEAYGKENFHMYLRDIGVSHFLEAEKNGDEALFQRSEALLQSLEFKGKDLLLFKIKMRYTDKNEDWETYRQTAIDYLENNVVRDVAMLNNIAWNFLTNVKSKDRYEYAEKWARKSTQLKSEYHNNDTLAHALYELDRKEEAKVVALKAIELGRKARTNYAGTTELLKKIEAK